MVARKIKKPHPINKKCDKTYCKRCRAKTCYGVIVSSTGLRSTKRETQPMEIEAPNQPIPRLPPVQNSDTKTVFLDLDATLIFATENSTARHDFVITSVVQGEAKTYYVLKRPGLDEFLEFLARKGFEVVLFTAGLRCYASPIVDILDPNGVISHRLFRDSCKRIDGSLVKDLSETGRDLTKVVIVDDNMDSFMLQQDNAIEITPFKDDLGDRELWTLMRFFEDYEGFDDFIEALRVFAPFGWQVAIMTSDGSESPSSSDGVLD